MAENEEERTSRDPPDEERGVRVSRDAAGAEGTGGRKRSKLGFRVQAQRREKWDDPVFDNVERPRAAEPPPAAEEPAASTADPEEANARAEESESEQGSSGVLGRFARFFRRGGGNR